MKKLLQYILIVFLLATTLVSCKDEEEVNPEPTINQQIYGLMKYWYLWNDEIPEVDPDNYSSPQALLEAVTFKPIDKWSFITSWQAFEQLFRQGSFSGFGMGLAFDSNSNLRITFTYSDSPAGIAGLDRGDIIKKINNQTVEALDQQDKLNEVLSNEETLQFEVEKLGGQLVDVSVTKGNVNINTVLYNDVIVEGERNIGYLVFNNFIDKSKDELLTVFGDFKAKGVNELVLDLRYNGGGTLGSTDTLASLIHQPANQGELFLEIAYNEDRSDENEPIFFRNLSQSIDVDRLYVITTGSSASASEAIINGLRPYINVTTIGTTTSGKPVGQSVVKIDDLAVGPIVFSVDNSLGQADYFNGLPADIPSADNTGVTWGDLNEDCLAAAIAAIKDEPGRKLKSYVKQPSKTIPMNGFRAEIGAW